MTAHTLQPPREIAHPCAEAQADGFPCSDTSSECGSCPRGLAQAARGLRPEMPDFPAKHANKKD